MKAVLALPVSWLCFYCGDLASYILEMFDENETWVDIWYPIYNTSMCWSTGAQDWAGGKGDWWPWGESSHS